ncbi:ABC transporter permease [Paenibacillus sp. FSL W8-1187]|uniref:Putative ABC transporter protein n=1 Tax=Paenibacillus pasadenensis TaxID=217090 RepID=A0A2N5N0S6_9BACL|nr:ABC transporter permease [Paenibacillus pasadenensis]PLT43929.1 putative ABC transporter protein [Paenibacillus pasadenensis]
MRRLLSAEWLKLRRSIVWLLLPVSPLIAFAVAWKAPLEAIGGAGWMEAYIISANVHGLMFLPLLVGIFAALLCRFEHASGGWKQLLALPVRPGAVYLSKLAALAGLVALLQQLLGAALLAGGLLRGMDGGVPWAELGRALLGGWVACLPLAALQLWASFAWSSFAAPLVLGTVFTLPNMLVVNSERFAPWYPWAQPLLAMMPRSEEGFGAFNVPAESLFLVIGGSFALFLAAGWLHFRRRAV